MEPEGSLPRLQVSPPAHILSQINPVHAPTSWTSIVILPSHLRLGLSSGLFPSGFSTKTLYTWDGIVWRLNKTHDNSIIWYDELEVKLFLRTNWRSMEKRGC